MEVPGRIVTLYRPERRPIATGVVVTLTTPAFTFQKNRMPDGLFVTVVATKRREVDRLSLVVHGIERDLDAGGTGGGQAIKNRHCQLSTIGIDHHVLFVRESLQRRRRDSEVRVREELGLRERVAPVLVRWHIARRGQLEIPVEPQDLP